MYQQSVVVIEQCFEKFRFCLDEEFFPCEREKLRISNRTTIESNRVSQNTRVTTLQRNETGKVFRNKSRDDLALSLVKIINNMSQVKLCMSFPK
mmetsp:Transcript_23322/g.47225  ORF Transcript_23322/g.47225 Transcript_23322/m.47225 type:complete len:94 (+) Transcript_23322:1568-1849(+)